jgi:hypothetical protein
VQTVKMLHDEVRPRRQDLGARFGIRGLGKNATVRGASQLTSRVGLRGSNTANLSA